jgi:hypothetical protein
MFAKQQIHFVGILNNKYYWSYTTVFNVLLIKNTDKLVYYD